MTRISENLESVQTRIRQCAGSANPPTLVAVSKTKPVEAIREAADAGQRHFGENYLQEAVEKIGALSDLDLCWHFIGHLQSNKTRAVAENFDWVQTLDRLKIARRLASQRPGHLPPLNVLLQVNFDDEPTKSGCHPDDLPLLAAQVADLGGLKLRGIMSIPAPQTSPDKQLQTCRAIRLIFDELRKQHPELDTLSLGMSADLEAAIKAGSTMVRVGTDIFGSRRQRTDRTA